MTTDTFWLQVSFDIASQDLAAAEEILLNNNALSVSIQDAQDQPIFEPLPGETPTWNDNRLSALFTQEIEPDTLLETIKSLLQHLNIDDFTIERIENQQWERVWMDEFKPIRFGEKLWIVPTHCSPPDKEAINLSLDPGLAFGTGSHPTTALCLEWLASNELSNLSLIDYGCGSGILAIAAAKLGAQAVYATDIDEQALSASHANATLNQVENIIELNTIAQFTNPTADIVIANILSSILIELSDALSQYCKANGRLILSGLLHSQIDEVIAAYTPWFQFLEPRVLEDWVLLEGIRKT